MLARYKVDVTFTPENAPPRPHHILVGASSATEALSLAERHFATFPGNSTFDVLGVSEAGSEGQQA